MDERQERHQPRRGDEVERWLRDWRDGYPGGSPAWLAADWLLDDYRLHADAGTPLDTEVPSG